GLWQSSCVTLPRVCHSGLCPAPFPSSSTLTISSSTFGLSSLNGRCQLIAIIPPSPSISIPLRLPHGDDRVTWRNYATRARLLGTPRHLYGNAWPSPCTVGTEVNRRRPCQTEACSPWCSR